MREPGVAKAGSSAVTITAARFLVLALASRILKPSFSVMASRYWRVKGEFLRESPVPFSPTTTP